VSEPAHLYEQMLVLRSQIGDDAAFEELMRNYQPRIEQFTRKLMIAAPDIVEDLNQEIWLAIYRGLPRLLDAGKFKPWAFRIARDRIFREFRRRRLAVRPIEESDLESAVDSGEPLPFAREDVERALEALSPEHREVLVLRFFEEMSYEGIAQATGSSLGTVRSRLHYGKRALKPLIEAFL
jgi:RNA polymerase sigma-70 factor (ECF subfamily)